MQLHLWEMTWACHSTVIDIASALRIASDFAGMHMLLGMEMHHSAGACHLRRSPLFPFFLFSLVFPAVQVHAWWMASWPNPHFRTSPCESHRPLTSSNLDDRHQIANLYTVPHVSTGSGTAVRTGFEGDIGCSGEKCKHMLGELFICRSTTISETRSIEWLQLMCPFLIAPLISPLRRAT